MPIEALVEREAQRFRGCAVRPLHRPLQLGRDQRGRPGDAARGARHGLRVCEGPEVLPLGLGRQLGLGLVWLGRVARLAEVR